jgi:ribosomal protein L24E
MAPQKLPGALHRRVGTVDIRSDGSWYYCCMTPPGCKKSQVLEQFRKPEDALKWAQENQE